MQENERQRVSCGKFCNFCFLTLTFSPKKMDMNLISDRLSTASIKYLNCPKPVFGRFQNGCNKVVIEFHWEKTKEKKSHTFQIKKWFHLSLFIFPTSILKSTSGLTLILLKLKTFFEISKPYCFTSMGERSTKSTARTTSSMKGKNRKQIEHSLKQERTRLIFWFFFFIRLANWLIIALNLVSCELKGFSFVH